MSAVAMTIAGSDPSGGAGMQADLKTFHQHGVYGTGILTLLTVQNTRSVREVHLLEPQLVVSQLEAVLDDIPPAAAKTGALGNAAVVKAVAERAADFPFPLVVDPVMFSKHGASLIDPEGRAALREALVPRAFLVTPNADEARFLSDVEVTDTDSMERAARAIADLGPAHVLIKGGRLQPEAKDGLWMDGRMVWFTSGAIETLQTHGTGCVYSAAITAHLARGVELSGAVERAKRFITEAIRTAPGLGHGIGPTNLHAAVPDVPEP